MKKQTLSNIVAILIVSLLVGGLQVTKTFGAVTATIPPDQLNWVSEQIQGSGGQASVVSETFESYGDDVLLTTSDDYEFAEFPDRGQGGATNSSTLFEADTGWLYTDVDASGTVWAYSGRPIDWPDKYFFRVNTQANLDVADQVVSFNYKSAAFGADGYGVEGGDATDIWLRYQNQYWLYIVQFDRTNNCIVAKRKVPAGTAAQYGGNDSHISNKGVYYTLYTNANQPIFGAGQQCISWAGVQSLLSAESGKPGFPNLAHDGTSATGTVYKFEARVTTYNGGGAFNYVQLQLFRGNVLVGSWVDNNLGTNAGGQTFQADWNAGYYNAVPGSSTAWGYPIYTAGATGLRSDNIKVWFDNFQYNAITQSPLVNVGGSLQLIEPGLSVLIGTSTAGTSKFKVASGTLLLMDVDNGGNVNIPGQLTIGSCVGCTSFWSLSGTNLTPTSTTYKVGVGTLNPSSTLHVVGGTSTLQSVQIGTTAGDNPLRITAATSYSASDSVGGTARITNTLNAGSGLGIYSNFAGSATNDLLVLWADNALYDRRALRAKTDGVLGAALFECTNATVNADCVTVSDQGQLTTLEVSGKSPDHGIVKITAYNDSGTQSDGSNASAAAVSLVVEDAAQGVFINGSSTSNTTGKFLQFRNYNSQYVFDVHHDGRLGIWSLNGNADAYLSVKATTSLAYSFLSFKDSSGGGIMTVNSTGTTIFGTSSLTITTSSQALARGIQIQGSHSTVNDYVVLANSGAFANGAIGIAFRNNSPTANFDYARVSALPGTSFNNSALILSTAGSNRVLTERIRIDKAGHLITTSTLPTVGCTAGSPTLSGTDVAGHMTAGAAATSCTITFASQWTTRPVCTATDESGSLALNAISTTSTLVVSNAALSGVVVNYICMGY